jgi:hypothetical protein
MFQQVKVLPHNSLLFTGIGPEKIARFGKSVPLFIVGKITISEMIIKAIFINRIIT